MDKRLEKFLAVVEYDSFTQAAQQLHVSQPALSVAIQELEKDAGAQLLHRQGKSLRLTPAGQIAYDSACRIRNEQRAMELQLSEHRSGGQQLLRLGLLDTIASALFAAPDTSLPAQMEVMVDNSDRLLRELRFGRIDAAITAAAPDENAKNLQAQRLRPERFVFVAAPAIAEKTSTRYIPNWLAFNPASHTYAQFVRDFEHSGMVVLPTFYSTSMDLIRSMAVAGKGVALLPRPFVTEAVATGTLQILNTPEFARNLWYVRPAGQAEHSDVHHLVVAVEALV
jgi:DNA-binding transcriptional LysR family regulator